jgi:DNA-binding protein YbaB
MADEVKVTVEKPGEDPPVEVKDEEATWPEMQKELESCVNRAVEAAVSKAMESQSSQTNQLLTSLTETLAGINASLTAQIAANQQQSQELIQSLSDRLAAKETPPKVEAEVVEAQADAAPEGMQDKSGEEKLVARRSIRTL